MPMPPAFANIRAALEQSFHKTPRADLLARIALVRARLGRGWTKGVTHARDAKGNSVDGNDPTAVVWTLSGAISAEVTVGADRETADALSLATRFLVGLIISWGGWANITELNEAAGSVDELLGILDRAASLIEPQNVSMAERPLVFAVFNPPQLPETPPDPANLN